MAEHTEQPPQDQPRPPEEPERPVQISGDSPPERFDVGNLHAPIMREKLEPRDGYEPVPIWLVSIFGAVLFWGGWYVATYSGGFRADVLEAEPAARFVRPAEVGDVLPDPITLGRRMYTAYCLACHQADGQGTPGQNPPLAGAEWVVGEPARLKRIVLQGMEGPVTVRGTVYDGVMPEFGRRLNDQQIAAVLTYIRQEWGNDAPAISPESVAATRAATADRVRAWTEAELLAIEEDDFPPEAAPGEAIEAEVEEEDEGVTR